MSTIQELLDKEASLASRRVMVHKQIKSARGDVPPLCWGNLDCSANTMSQCPWRVDCDSHEAEQWQSK